MKYNNLIIPDYQIGETMKEGNELPTNKSYSIPLYIIRIKETAQPQTRIYEALPKLKNKLDFISTKNKFIGYLNQNLNDLNPEFGFIKLDQLLDYLRNFFHTITLSQELISNDHDIEQQIIFFWAYLTGLVKILPFLLDKNIEEIFISPNTETITIDHFIYGRITTNILISNKEKENILYRTAMENNLELNQLNPSIKGDLQVKGLFSLRITGDIQPFSYDGTILNIRKLNQREFSLETLIKLNSIDPLTSAFLKTMIISGVNITIVGSPSSGKTTLQNALLLELPLFWRVFSFENTLETNIKRENYFRFKIFDYLKRKNDLSTIFSQLLHRSPDFVNLGEIVNQEEALAWNACMSAGIPIIQTIHSNSTDGLISRITNVFKIPIDLLSSSIPHIVVEVKYFWNNFKKERKVTSVSEFIINKERKLVLKPLISYDLKLKKNIWQSSPKEASTFEWIKLHKNPKIVEIFESANQVYQDI